MTFLFEGFDELAAYLEKRADEIGSGNSAASKVPGEGIVAQIKRNEAIAAGLKIAADIVRQSRIQGASS
jgi:hypothetical protein